MKKITESNLRKTPTAYQKAVALDFKKDFEDMSFLYDVNGTNIYAECTDGLVSIDNSLLKELGIENSIN
jgi:DNA mismatch repair ATPase MutL